MTGIWIKIICAGIFLTTCMANNANVVQASSKCMEALKKFPRPDAIYTAKHLDNHCPDLCRNSTGQHPTGQFSHPWDCNAFINCYENDAWVHWCQKGLNFNEKNQQCDWPNVVKCTQRGFPTAAPTPTQLSASICKDSDPLFNVVEHIGDRPDLCLSGSGQYSAPDCRFYVRCNGTDAWVAKCPAGFMFDSVHRRCDWPQKVQQCLNLCSSSEKYVVEETTTTTTTAPPASSVATGSTRLFVSTTTAKPTTTSTTTLKPTTTTTTEPPHDPLCKNVTGNYEYPNDCKKFVTCIGWHANLRDCPMGLVFVEASRRCDWTFTLPITHKCYKPFDDGTTDCPFYRDTNETSH